MNWVLSPAGSRAGTRLQSFCDPTQCSVPVQSGDQGLSATADPALFFAIPLPGGLWGSFKHSRGEETPCR